MVHIVILLMHYSHQSILQLTFLATSFFFKLDATDSIQHTLNPLWTSMTESDVVAE